MEIAMRKRINVGCGPNPTPGWLNLDNSPSVLLGRVPGLVAVLGATRLLRGVQGDFANTARSNGTVWANAGRLPVFDRSADTVYSSHMLEHLSQAEARRFLHEVQRVLVSGGVLRLGVPDLAVLVREYLTDHDADRFIHRTLMAQERPRSLRRRVSLLFTGHRGHAWMYDGRSLVQLLIEHGFVDVAVTVAGQTRISDPGALDLNERSGETVYVEACKA